MTKEEIVKTEALEARYKRYKSILKDLTIMSDVFMRNVFKKRECTEYVLQVIMEKKSEDFKDEAHIIYVNSKKQDDTELGRLVHDLHCKNAGDMHNKILADRVYELKETQKGVEFMCREMEQIYSEGIENGEKLGIAKGEKLGIEKGELKKAKTSALSMAADGMQVSKIAHYLNVSVQMVQKWIDENV